VTVNEWASRTFTIQADPDYQIKTLYIDGVPGDYPAGYTSETYTFTSVTSDHTISVVFESTSGPTYYNLTLNADAGMGSITASPQQAQYVDGTPVQLTATPTSGYQFMGWSGDLSGNTNPATIIVDRDKAVTANFYPVTQPRYTLTTLAVDGKGTVARMPDLTEYDSETQVTLTAAPISGYRFSSWSGDLSGSLNPAAIVMDNNKSVYANFIPVSVQTHTITASAGTGGSITPGGNITVSEGTSQSFTIQADSGYQIQAMYIDGVGGEYADGYTVETYTFYGITSNHSISAVFESTSGGPTYYNLTLNVNASMGSVTRLPAQTQYVDGTPVQLTAVPYTNHNFLRWEGDLSGNTNPVTVAMNGNKIITAVFESLVAPTYELTVNAVNGSVVKSPDQAQYDSGTPVTLTAAPISGYQFSGWSGDLSGNTNPASIIMDRAKSITAQFIPIAVQQYSLTVVSGSGSGTYNSGAVVTIQASTPPAGQVFSHWSGDVANVADANSLSTTIAMIANAVVTANYTSSGVNTHTITATASAGGTISPSGSVIVNEWTSQSFIIQADAGYMIKRLYIDGAQGDYPDGITFESYTFYYMTRSHSINVEFQSTSGGPTQYSLTLNVDTNLGNIIISPDQAQYDEGTVVTLTAAPNAGYSFLNWSGDVSGNTNPTSIVMNGSRSVTATFGSVGPGIYTLSVVNGTGSGSYDYGEVVTIQANVPPAGQRFSHWSGGIEYISTVTGSVTTITMFTSVTVTANYTASGVETQIIAATSSEGGTITPGGDVVVNLGDNYSFTFQAAPGYYIKTLYLNGAPGDYPAGITSDMYTFYNVTRDQSIRVVFESESGGPTYYNLTLIADASQGNVTMSPALTQYSPAAPVTLTATANPGYNFVSWSGAISGSENPTTIIMNSDKVVSAVFSVVHGDPTEPWNFNPDNYRNYPYFLPIYGTALVDGMNLSVGDWVGVFDVAGNCYGAGQYRYNSDRDRYYYIISVYPESAEDGITGFAPGEEMLFKFYLVGTQEEIIAVDATSSMHFYPATIGLDVDPIEVNLEGTSSGNGEPIDIESIQLESGWNFISFNVAPDNPNVEAVFSPILDRVEFIRDHMHWWRNGIGGSLTTVTPYHSYYVKASASCTLVVKGSAVTLPHTYNLDVGWNNISYLYSGQQDALGTDAAPGYFRNIIDNIVWIKGPGSEWCKPGLIDMQLDSGKGIFIKLDQAVSFHVPERGDATLYTLNITAVNGEVVKSPDYALYDAGTPVMLLPTPEAGYQFDHWGGDLSGNA